MPLKRQIADGVDDIAASLAQMRQRRAAGDHRAAHIHRIGPVPEGGGHMLDIAVLLRNLGAEQRSIVVQHIQPPEMRNGLRDHRLDAVSLFQIERDRQSARQPLRQFPCTVESDIRDRHQRPAPRHQLRRGPADPPAPPVISATLPSSRIAS
jgi:hypothetical protein